jgi:hypothetical protein
MQLFSNTQLIFLDSSFPSDESLSLQGRMEFAGKLLENNFLIEEKKAGKKGSTFSISYNNVPREKLKEVLRGTGAVKEIDHFLQRIATKISEIERELQDEQSSTISFLD